MTDSVYQQVMEAIRDDIRALSLDRIEDAEIQVRKVFSNVVFEHRGITITPEVEQNDDVNPIEGTNERDLIGYPCLLTLVDGTGQGWSDNISNITTWRQSIRRAFSNQRLTGISDTGIHPVCCRVQHRQPVVPQQFQENRDIGQMVIWAWYLEPRGSS